MKPVYDFVLAAKTSVDMTMYELVDPTMVSDLAADQRRHVKVRVILDTNREASRNGPAFQALRAGGVKVVWADTIYEATHQKTITVDGTESLILPPISPTSTTRRPAISASSTATRRMSRPSRPSSPRTSLMNPSGLRMAPTSSGARPGRPRCSRR